MRSLKDIFSVKDGGVSGLLPFSELESYPEIHTNVKIIIVDPWGKMLETLDLGENVITNQGRSNMAHLLAGDDMSNRYVITMKFGDGGHNPSNPTQALPTYPTDTGLYGNLVITKTVTYSFPDGANANKVMFAATINANEGNGAGAQAYSEVILTDLTGRCLMHKTYGLITKNNAFGMILNYSIIF